MDATMRTIFTELERHVQHLYALLSAAHTTEVPRFFEIRQSLREIQSLLQGDELDHHDGCFSLEEDGGDNPILLGFVQDLVQLVTLEFECEDPSVSELVDAIIPRSAELVSFFSVSNDLPLNEEQLQRVFSRVLYHVQQGNQTLAPPLLHLIQSQNLDLEVMSRILAHPEDCFESLEILLNCVGVHNPIGSFDPSLVQLLGLIDSVLIFWTKVHLCDQDIAGWIQRTLMSGSMSSTSQASSYQQGHLPTPTGTPLALQQRVDAFISSLEDYCTDLSEAALRLLENVDATEEELSDSTLIVRLQYATLAASCAICVGACSTSMKLPGMAKSLWRALCTFVVDHLTPTLNEDNCDNIPKPLIMQLPAGREACQRAATDILWKLASFCVDLNCYERSNDDLSPCVSLTVFRIWQHADSSWNDDAQKWVTFLLDATPYADALRHSMQARLWTMASEPNMNQQEKSASKDTLAFFASKVLDDDDEDDRSTTTTDEQDDDSYGDPWREFVQEQLMVALK